MTTTTLTADELREQISEHEATIVAAERDAGAALRAGTSTTAALRRADQAHGAIKAARAAIEQLEGEAAQAAERERQKAASEVRLMNYEWAERFAGLAVEVVAAEETFRAADKRMREHYSARGGGAIKTVKVRLTHDESDLCAAVTHGLPVLPEPIPARRWRTAEQLEAYRALTAQRAEDERSGEGRDWSGEPAPGERERQQARQERREEIKAERERQQQGRVLAQPETEMSELTPEHGRAQWIGGQAA